MDKTVGQHLQNWMIRHGVTVISPAFVPSVDLAIKNAVRDQGAASAIEQPVHKPIGDGSDMSRIGVRGHR